MRDIWRNNGLSIALLVMFLVFLVGQVLTGQIEYNGEQVERGQEPVAMGAYLRSGHFREATAENWESEFLQLLVYVLLTVALIQRGSSESKDPDKRERPDPAPDASAAAPASVRRGGWVLNLYANSLSLAFLLLFLLSFVVHAVGGAADYNQEQLAKGAAPVSVPGYLHTSRFWFESFQNWQSEFLALFAMVVLSIFLRQRGSPESKRVDAPHRATGGG